ncbi:MAG: hypothetical protein AAF416_01100 [Pseudomonadota bacterium]
MLVPAGLLMAPVVLLPGEQSTAQAQTTQPRGRLAEPYTGGSGSSGFRGSSSASSPSGRLARPFTGGSNRTTSPPSVDYRSEVSKVRERQTSGAEERCTSLLREKYGAEEIGDLDLRRRSSDRQRIYTTIKRPDGTELNMRCVIRNNRLAAVEEGGGNAWEEAEEYVPPPEPETPAEGETAEDAPDGDRPAPDARDERAGGADDADDRSDDRAGGEDDDDSPEDSDTAEAEEPSGPKRIKVPTADAPRL